MRSSMPWRSPRQAIDVLAAIHGIDWRAAGLSAAPGSYVERQILRWRDQLARTPTARRLGDLEPLWTWLLAHRPPDEDQTIVHGDFGFHNLLITADRVTAVLDWELATIGDPLVDLVGLLKSWGPGGDAVNPANDVVARAARALSRNELIARYEGATGRDYVTKRAFYDALALWRSIGITEGVFARGRGDHLADSVSAMVKRLRDLTGAASAASAASAAPPSVLSRTSTRPTPR